MWLALASVLATLTPLGIFTPCPAPGQHACCTGNAMLARPACCPAVAPAIAAPAHENRGLVEPLHSLSPDKGSSAELSIVANVPPRSRTTSAQRPATVLRT